MGEDLRPGGKPPRVGWGEGDSALEGTQRVQRSPHLMAPWICAIPPNKAPKIQEEAGEAGCWRSQVTDFVDPSLGLKIPAPPVAAQPPARPTTPPPGAPFSPPFHQHPDSSAPQAVVLSWNCTQLRMRTPTSHSLPEPCPS